MAERILVVDDEREIADLVEVYLRNENYDVRTFYSAQDALACVASERIDLALLDVMLPDMSGFLLCKQLRERYNFPILMLTAKVDETDKITGLTLGADDYITKPFRPLELVARVKAQLRRYTKYNPAQTAEEPAGALICRDLVLDPSSHECRLAHGIRPAAHPAGAAGQSGQRRGAVPRHLGGRILLQEQQHHLRPHPPSAGEDGGYGGPAQIHQDCLGSGVSN